MLMSKWWAGQVRHQIPLVPVLDGVDCFPSYFIVGGLVILPLSVPFLGHAFGCVRACLSMLLPPILL